tara:strand:- start:450 stop:1523 length:1074 start_codon:yes stop_codon:yes gene_type:complete
MSLFKDMLKSGESLFRDTIVLSYDFQPKLLKYRENEQMRFAVAIRPLLQERSGRNLFVYGAPGIGKTTACRHVIRELEESGEEVVPIYINCWKENTTFKIFTKICEEFGHKFLQQKKTTDLFNIIRAKLNKAGTSAVFIFDEIDKLDDFDYLYTILEDIYRKSIFLITNYKESYDALDERIKSRLGIEFLYFRPYNQAEIRGILEERKKYAFVPEIWQTEAFDKLVEKTAQLGDLRVGLYMMREACNLAEDKSLKQISLEQVEEAVYKVDEFQIKEKDGLDEELINILDLVKNNSQSRIGDLFGLYEKHAGKLSYKSFKRKIDKLKDGRFISTKQDRTQGGVTTIVSYGGEKKLTDF